MGHYLDLFTSKKLQENFLRKQLQNSASKELDYAVATRGHTHPGVIICSKMHLPAHTHLNFVTMLGFMRAHQISVG